MTKEQSKRKNEQLEESLKALNAIKWHTVTYVEEDNDKILWLKDGENFETPKAKVKGQIKQGEDILETVLLETVDGVFYPTYRLK